MKKFTTVALLLFLLSSNLTYPSVDSSNNSDKQTFTASCNSDFGLDKEYDDLDILIGDIHIDPPKQSKFKIMCAKVGMVLFLKPYIFVVKKYRIIKKLVSKYAETAWKKLTYKKPIE